MKKPTEMTAEDFDPFLFKTVVVTYRDQKKSSDAQILRGVLDQVKLESERPHKPMQLVIRNDVGELLKVSIFDLEGIREEE